MFARLANLSKNKYARDIAIVFSGAAGAQVISVAASPLLSRLYDPDEFGLYGIFLGVSQIAGAVACGRYELAINLPEERGEAAQITMLCVTLTAATAIVAGLGAAVAVFAGWIDGWNNSLYWLLGLPAYIVAHGCSLAANGFCNREKLFSLQARNGVLRAAITMGLSIGLGILSVGQGLMIGLLLGTLVSTAVLWWQLQANFSYRFERIPWEKARALLKRYANFPKFLLFSTFVENGAAQLPSFIFGHFYGLATVGHFAFANRIINLPTALLSRSFGDVFRSNAAEAYAKRGDCRALLLDTVRHLALFGIPAVLVMAFAAPWLFTWVFGEPWREAGVYTQLLAVMIGVRLVISPVTVMFYIAEKQSTDLIIQAITFSLVFAVLWVVGGLGLSARYAIAAYAAVYIAKYIAEFICSMRFSVKEVAA